MNNWLLKQYVNMKVKQNLLKTEHYCEDCHKTGLVIRRMSVLYLIFYILAGVLSGWLIKWWIGFIISFFLIWRDIQKSEPQCRYCFSTNVRVFNLKPDTKQQIESS